MAQMRTDRKYRYIVMFVDPEQTGRNTSIIGDFNTREQAILAVTATVRGCFGGEDAPIVEEDPESGSYFLIQYFEENKGPSIYFSLPISWIVTK